MAWPTYRHLNCGDVDGDPKSHFFRDEMSPLNVSEIAKSTCSKAS